MKTRGEIMYEPCSTEGSLQGEMNYAPDTQSQTWQATQPAHWLRGCALEFLI